MDEPGIFARMYDCMFGWIFRMPSFLSVEEISADHYKNQKMKKRKAKIPHDSKIKAIIRSFGGFFFGLFFTTIYGAIIMFVKNYNIWYCMVSTITMALFVGLGMGFSIKVRATMLLMIPQIFSEEGKNFILLTAFTLAMQGPLMNIMENFQRSASSVSCGAELALNQTLEILRKIKQPLMSALDKLKKIGQKGKMVADQVKRFFKAVMDGIKHITRALRNIWYFMVQIGDICNEEMGKPYYKCCKIFDDAHDSCMKVIPFLFFLCYIILIFRFLCLIAKLLLLFCIIPQFIQTFLRKYVAQPVMAAIAKVKKEFDFNITLKHSFEIDLNSSKTITQIALDIMEEVDVRTNPYREFLGMFGYGATFLTIYVYLQALNYRKKYLFDDNFDNVYISRDFIEIDVMRARLGKDTLLPLMSSESYRFIRPESLFMTAREKKGYTIAMTNTFRHMLIVTFFVIMDYIIFWIFDMVRYLLQGEIIARAPVLVTVTINGTGFTGEIYGDIVSAFDALQRGNITVLSKKCSLDPSEPDYRGYLLIGMMYGISFFITMFGAFIIRLQRGICAAYYPSREQERICFLYNNILTKRMSIVSALSKSVKRNAEDTGHTNPLLILAVKCPGCAFLAKMMGVKEQYCLACGKICGPINSETFLSCITPGCKGFYCKECYELLENVCTICSAPLTYEYLKDQEIDSSDEEQIILWMKALEIKKAKEKVKRLKMKKVLIQRIKESIQARGSSGTFSASILEKAGYLDLDAESSSAGSELDFSYQDKSEASEGEMSDNQDPLAFTKKRNQEDLVSPTLFRDFRKLRREKVRADAILQAEGSSGQGEESSIVSSESTSLEMGDSGGQFEETGFESEGICVPPEDSISESESTSSDSESSRYESESTSCDLESSSETDDICLESEDTILLVEDASSPLDNTCILMGDTSSPLDNTCILVDDTSSQSDNTCILVDDTSSQSDNTCILVDDTSSQSDDTYVLVEVTSSHSGNTCPLMGDTILQIEDEC